MKLASMLTYLTFPILLSQLYSNFVHNPGYACPRKKDYRMLMNLDFIAKYVKFGLILGYKDI
jgi:hypothetical protein